METPKEIILKAFKEGKTIESRDGNGWKDSIPQNQLDKPNLDYGGIDNWRIKPESTMQPLLKLLEGWESKEDFAIYKRTFNNIPYPRVEWECNCGFKHCLNEGFEQDYRKDNFKEIRLPTGNCLKCKKEIKTHSLESKEVLQVENTVFNIDFGGHVMAGLKIVNGEIEVVGAMNGYGNGISADKIIIIKSNQ